ncbi:MAG TPA: protein kinase [Gemmataceae bacterium]|nr:protein kinase [Gemmataceae bacterium]
MSQPSASQAAMTTRDAALSAADADLTGRTLGDFHLVRCLGQGGMGQVYLAEQISLKRKVALKLLRPELACNATALLRFRNEAEAVARVMHPNIVQVYAVGEQDGLHYMALEYVEGCNLKEYLARKGRPDVALALSVMRQVAAALQRAAESGLIHRDIKPENILLTRKGRVKVADFGLSRCFGEGQEALSLTQSGVAMGTPLYMSPEQVQGHPLDPRTDIYSFGVTCYHMLSGSPPFRGQTAFEVAVQHVQTQSQPLCELRPDLPAELGAVVDRMMAKKPDERYPSAYELYQELGRLRAALSAPGGLKPAGGSSKLLPAVGLRRVGRRLGWLVAASVMATLAGGAALGWWQHRPRPVSTAEPAAPSLAVTVETPAQKREMALLETIHLYDHPIDNHDRSLGLDLRLELGVLYVDQRRLNEAEKYFTGLAKDATSVPAYRLLGRMGQAMVLAYQDRAQESVKLLKELFGGGRLNGVRKWEMAVANRSPQFRRQLAEAMRRNAANLPSYPSELRRLLEVGPLWLPPAGKAGQQRASRLGEPRP